MNLYGLSGFILGFIFGMIVNAWLLSGIPRDQYMADKNLRLRYGLLNWGIALIGMGIGLAIEQTKH